MGCEAWNQSNSSRLTTTSHCNQWYAVSILQEYGVNWHICSVVKFEEFSDGQHHPSCIPADLGIGVRISGGMMCKSCGILHAVITAVNRNSTHSSEICEGMCTCMYVCDDDDGADL